MLMMVLCDREGRIYDVWISFGSMHEVRAFRERKKRRVWFRGLAEMVRVGVSLGARRERGKVWWAKRRRKIVRRDNG